MTKHSGIAVAVVFLLAGGPVDAGQTEPVDARWMPWLGCWQLWEEQFESVESLGADDGSGISSLVERTSVCTTPTSTGITLTASAGEQVLVERHLVADGEPHPVTEDTCEGWERSEWSRDGHRLFTSAELACGDEPTRRVRGVSLMASPSSWVDIQLVEMGEHQQLEVRRYAPMRLRDADPLAARRSEIRQARRESAEAPILSDVTEAAAKTAPRVVEALLVETEPRLALDSAALIVLDDAGVNHDVIDLLVALSYPEQFVVQRRDRSGTWSSGSSGYGGFGGFYDPIWYSDLYPYYVTPFGSRYWGGRYNPYLYGTAVASPFVIIPGNPVEQPTARAVRGRGYTRVLPREPEPSQGAVSRGRTASGSSGGSTVGTGSSGGSGRGGASQGGYSGGSSRTGRRAVPR